MARAALAALAVALLAAGSAQGRMRVVARDGGLVLRAETSPRGLCLRLERPGTARPFRGRRCGPVPLSPFRPLELRPYRAYAFAAAVPEAVRVAEATTRRGPVRYPARAVRGLPARFVLIKTPPAVSLIRLRAADGSPLSLLGGPNGYIGFDDDRAEVTEGVTANTQPSIAPLPGAPDRLARVACVQLVHGSGGNGFCDWDGLGGIVVQSGCGEADLVGGVLEPGAVAVRLALGSGASLDVPASAPSPAYAGRAVFGRLVPKGEAIRSATALDAGGAPLASSLVGTPPSAQPCTGPDQAFDGVSLPLAPEPPLVPTEVAAAGGHRLVVAARGDVLCAGLDTLPVTRCPSPPVDAVEPRLFQRGTTVAGVLSEAAARVTLDVVGGPDLEVDTTAGDRVRFFAAEVPAGATVAGTTVRDARGEVIGRGTHPPRQLDRSRRTVVEDGGLGLELSRRGAAEPCLQPFAPQAPPSQRLCTDLTPSTPIDGPDLAYSANVTVPCEPRRALAWGRFPDRMHTPTVELTDGTRLKTTRLRLRGEDAFAAFLPDAGVAGFRAGRRHVALALPPASAQCGYSVARSL